MSSAVEEWLEQNTAKCPLGRLTKAQCQSNRARPTVADHYKRVEGRKMSPEESRSILFRPGDCEECTEWKELFGSLEKFAPRPKKRIKHWTGVSREIIREAGIKEQGILRAAPQRIGQFEDTPEKQCARCKESWPATSEFFYKKADARDGLHSYCKACVTERCAELREQEAGSGQGKSQSGKKSQKDAPGSPKIELPKRLEHSQEIVPELEEFDQGPNGQLESERSEGSVGIGGSTLLLGDAEISPELDSGLRRNDEEKAAPASLPDSVPGIFIARPKKKPSGIEAKTEEKSVKEAKSEEVARRENQKELIPAPVLIPASCSPLPASLVPRRRTAWNKKPPAKVTCPCGVVFDVHPQYLATIYQYHSPECRKKYGHSGKFGKFTPEQDAQIAEVYRNLAGLGKGTAPVRALAAQFGLPRWKISNRAFSLGLVAKSTYPDDRPWNDAEIELLKQVAGLSIGRICALFRKAGYKRGRNAVTIKIRKIFGCKPTEGYTGCSLAKLFGIDSHAVASWIEMGRLKAEPRGTERRPAQGGDHLLIREADVRRFVIENVAIIDFRKLDKFWLVELLAAQEGKREAGSEEQESKTVESFPKGYAVINPEEKIVGFATADTAEKNCGGGGLLRSTTGK